jgi:hypothetical protein
MVTAGVGSIVSQDVDGNNAAACPCQETAWHPIYDSISLQKKEKTLPINLAFAVRRRSLVKTLKISGSTGRWIGSGIVLQTIEKYKLTDQFGNWKTLRAILNFTPGPQGEICPLGGIFTPSFTHKGEHSLLCRIMEGQTENFTPGDNFTPRGQNSPPGGTTSSLGAKFDPRGEATNGP